MNFAYAPCSNGQVSIEDVLSERMAFDGHEASEVSGVLAKYLAKEKQGYSDQGGISELQRCRLRACLYSTDNQLMAWGFSDDIIHAGDKV